ncbi:MAG: ribosomal protein S18-alanine N-acetyltransferase [Bacillota bacterium]
MAAETEDNRKPVFGLRPAITAMLPGHLEQVLDIENKSFPTPWSYRSFMFEVTENDFSLYTVALVDGRVVGYSGMWIVLDEAHITNIAVHPDYRGKGYGRVLLEDLLGRAAVMGALKITLEVRVSNHVARTLYQSMGFIEMGMRKKYYTDNDEDAIIMVLDLGKYAKE